MHKRVAVLMGGWGEEREISIKTGEAIFAALEANGHHPTRVFAGPGLDTLLRSAPFDAVFIALHGRMGEDGRVQALCDLLDLPYTGSGVLASAVAMNKPMSKRLFQQQNLATPFGYSIRLSDAGRAVELHADLGFPCVVKPSCGGSSVGLSIVHTEADLVDAVRRAAAFGGEALVERRIVGQELSVGILGDRVLGTVEISFSTETFDYHRKYKSGAQYFLPPRLSPARVRNVEAMALAAYRSLGCRGYGRVDVIASDTQNDLLLEVNTLPGMTRTSLLPKIAAAAGLSFEALIDQILERATLDRAEPTSSATVEGGPVATAPIRHVGNG